MIGKESQQRRSNLSCSSDVMVTDCLPPDDRKSLFHAFYLVVHSINIHLVKQLSNLHDLFLKIIQKLVILETLDVP